MNRFDELAATWDANPGRIKLAGEVAGTIAEAVALDAGMQTLDFGCGTGLVSVLLAGRVGSVTAVDNSTGMIETLRRKLDERGIQNVAPRSADLMGPDCLEDTFDLVFSSMAFHHVEDTPRCLRTLHDLLSPGGVVAIADLDQEDGTFHDEGVEVPHHGFERPAFRKAMEQAGFEDVEDRTVMVIPGAARGRDRDYPVFLFTGRRRATGANVE